MRFVASGNFLLAIPMFFLPWIDLRCGSAEFGSTIVRQSGLDIARGEYEPRDGFEDAQNAVARVGWRIEGTPHSDKVKGVEEAPLLWGYLGVLVVGALGCALIRSRPAWRFLVLGCTLATVVLLGIPTFGGFPIEHDHRYLQHDQLNQGGEKRRIYIQYQAGFYIAWSLAALPLVWLLIDSLISRPSKRRRFERMLNERDDVLD